MTVSVVVALIIIMSIIMSIFFYLQYTIQRRDLINNLKDKSMLSLSRIIRGSLKHAMLTRDLEETEYIIKSVSAEEEVKDVFLVDKEGEIKIASDDSMIGRKFDLRGPTCQICHQYEPENRSKSVIFTTETGKEIFRNVNPIINEKECYNNGQCHDSETKINGVLIADFSMSHIEAQRAAKFKEMVFSLVLMIIVSAVVSTVTISFMMNRMVINKLERFVKATKLFSKGNFEQKVAIEGNDEIAELAVSFNQMAETLRRTKEIRERKELLENVLNNVQESIIIIGPEGTIISFSRGAEEMVGYKAEEVVGKEYATLGNQRKEIWEQLNKGEMFQGEVSLTAKNGRLFPASLTVLLLRDETDDPLVFVEVVRDLTEEKAKEKLQQQLVHAERLAATGQLAAGVAHELNNPLGNILLYSKLLLEDLKPEDAMYKNLNKIVENTLRSKNVVSDLLNYTRQSEAYLKLNDINEIAESSVTMLKNQMGIHNIECELNLNKDISKVNCDKSQIQQVFVNLIQNAIEAIENDGKIGIFTDISDDDGILFGVTDNGPGIPEELMSRIFEPFYTTKESGSGLGLSLCHGIVEKHGGKIWLERGYSTAPESSSGTTVYVKLPLQ